MEESTLKSLFEEYLVREELVKEWSVIDVLPTISDIEKLIHYLRIAPYRSEFARLIGARMVEVFKDLLPCISSPEQLADYWERISEKHSESKKVIEARLEEILKEILPTLTDMNQLIRYRKIATSGSKLVELIEDRMVEVLEGITDLGKLLDYCYKVLHFGSGLVKQFRFRTMKVLISVTDIEQLFSSYSSFFEEPFELKIAELLKGITDINQLFRYWRAVHGRAKLRSWNELIESRITAVLKDTLPTITDMAQLIDYEEKALGGSIAEPIAKEPIQYRMVELVNQIDPANVEQIPEWFIKMLQEPLSIPFPISMREGFTRKAKAIFDNL